jgi:lipopolysaccharide O-acetyltransferase
MPKLTNLINFLCLKKKGFDSRFATAFYRIRCGKIGINTKLEKVQSLLNPEHIFLGSNTTIGVGARLDCIRSYLDKKHTGVLVIGDRVTINPHSHISAATTLEIGNDVLIASGVYISDHDHGYAREIPPASMPLVVKKITIEDSVWIGEKAIILKGVTLGKGAIIGGGSVVTRDVAPFTIVAGVPARKIRNY